MQLCYVIGHATPEHNEGDIHRERHVIVNKNEANKE